MTTDTKRILWVEPWMERRDLVAAIESAGHHVILGRPTTDQTPYREDDLVEMLREVDAVMVGSRERYPRRVLEAAESLVTVAKLGIGVERIDLDAATDLGILVSNTPIAENFLAVAESAVGFILALAKNLKRGDRHARQGLWRQYTNTFLRGKTVGIVGLGRIGTRVADLLRPFEVRLLAFDPYVDPQRARAADVELVSLETLLRESDFVTLHTVTTDETRGLMGEAQFRLMKPTACLVNTARGALVDEAALARALRDGQLAAAALDVYEPEPPSPDNPLLGDDLYDATLLSPHAAGMSQELVQRMPTVMVENCLAALRGDPPEFIVNPQVLPRWRGRQG